MRMYYLCFVLLLLVISCDPSTKSDGNSPKKTGVVAKMEVCPGNECFCVDDVYIGGRMTQESIDALKKKGAKTIVNLMADEEMKWDEKQHVESEKLNYYQCGIDPKDREYKNIDKMLEVFGNQNNFPIVVHCSGGNRAAAIWAMHQVTTKKLTPEQAVEKMQEMSLKPVVMEYFQGYVEKKLKDSK